MNGWRARLTLLGLFFAATELHALVMKALHLPYTEEAGAFFFLTAATADWLLLCSAPRLISERLCDDIQALCIAAIVVNCAGLCAYLAESPPSLYYMLMTGVTYAQYLRLLFVGRHDADYHERAVHPGADCVRA